MSKGKRWCVFRNVIYLSTSTLVNRSTQGLVRFGLFHNVTVVYSGSLFIFCSCLQSRDVTHDDRRNTSTRHMAAGAGPTQKVGQVFWCNVLQKCFCCWFSASNVNLFECLTENFCERAKFINLSKSYFTLGSNHGFIIFHMATKIVGAFTTNILLSVSG